MRYRLRTLLIVLGLAPPILAVVWFWTHSVAAMAGWFGFAALFGLVYWTLSKSQSLPRETRGSKMREPGDYRSDNWPF